jgi:hypothetical protein
MNALDLIFQLFYIRNPPKLVILTPCHSPYMPSTDYANTSVDSTNTSVDCANKSVDYAHTFDDYANTDDLANAPDTPASDFCIPYSSLL